MSSPYSVQSQLDDHERRIRTLERKSTPSPFKLTGKVTLSGGSATVSYAGTSSDSLILLTGQTTQGRFWVGTRTAGVSFVINGNDGGENSVVAYAVIG